MSTAPAVRAAESHRGGADAEAPELSVSSSEPVSAKHAEKAITTFLAATPGLGADTAAQLRDARDAMRAERKLLDTAAKGAKS